METKFTKGKWVITDEDDNGLYIHDLKKTSAICRIYKENNLVKGKDGNYNALLISKAREMFKMLKSVLELQKENYGSGMNTHLALITKAKEIEQLLKEATEL